MSLVPSYIAGQMDTLEVVSKDLEVILGWLPGDFHPNVFVELIRVNLGYKDGGGRRIYLGQCRLLQFVLHT